VLDNLSTHTDARGHWRGWSATAGALYFTPGGCPDQPDRRLVRHHHPQSIRSGHVHPRDRLIKQSATYIDHWNIQLKPFVWTAMLMTSFKVSSLQTNIKNSRKQSQVK